MSTIERYGKLSVTELIQKCVALAGLTPQRVRPCLPSLIADGKLKETTQTEDHRIHYYYEKAE